MHIRPFSALACPLDLEKLTFKDSSFICPCSHTFDAARQGYVNLLPAHLKRSKNPGDQKEMVDARAAFLTSGAYEPVLQTVYQILSNEMSVSKRCHFNIIDAGCGEGYYTAGLAGKFVDTSLAKTVSIFGYDISKQAVMAAAKRNKDITWAVATNARIPVLAASADMVICLFGFPHFQEFERILKKGGLVVLIDAGARHLYELREKIYDTVYIKENPTPKIYPGFTQISCTSHRFALTNMTSNHVSNLLKMTPHYYRMQKQKFDAVVADPPQSVTLDFYASCYTLNR